MGINRKGLKWRARDAMRAARPNTTLMTLIYLLLTTGLSLLVGVLIADPLSRILHLYEQGVELVRAIPLAVAGIGSVGLFVNILLAVFGGVMDFGYRRWCLNATRGEQGEAGDLIDGFSMVGRILWLRILMLLYGFAWYLVIFMPALLFVMAGSLVPLMGPLVGTGVFVMAVLLFITRILRYSMAIYCLVDEPDKGATHALRRSRQMMAGRMRDYILLHLSFLGWRALGVFLGALVGGAVIALLGGGNLLTMDLEALETIQNSVTMAVAVALAALPLDLWLTPYVTMTECKFYDQIKGGAEIAPF